MSFDETKNEFYQNLTFFARDGGDTKFTRNNMIGQYGKFCRNLAENQNHGIIVHNSTVYWPSAAKPAPKVAQAGQRTRDRRGCCIVADAQPEREGRVEKGEHALP